ncbi:LuxR C-terminal-related transcriptional regulator [Edaphovirga cremea]|uniref:LuxR C-terminal-related transcriptional regulator n=1 Tax=Edaphovirga cremea TaxID=2267246 RepID=UPI000DEFA711|nr:LuxR C-terminal-related transcriptional regulator [Edaphovirga cremea]
MAKKRVAIQCPCLYTRKGIEEILLDTQFSAKCKIVASISHLDQYENRLIKLTTVDIIIVTLSSTVDDPASTLRLFGEFLPTAHPNARILLIADIIPTGVMARYLSDLKNIGAVLDTSKSLDVLENQLVINIGKFAEVYKFGKVAALPLSLRETIVLRRLLEGEKTAGIAKDLQISPKTVSNYKRSAMVKLNIRSLQPLIINERNNESLNDEVELSSSGINNKNPVSKYFPIWK